MGFFETIKKSICTDVEPFKKEIELLKDQNSSLGRSIFLKEEEIAQLHKRIESLSKPFEELVEDKKYWDNKWQQSVVTYSAPKSKRVVEYVKYKKIDQITQIASAILTKNKFSKADQVPKLVLTWLNDQFKNKNFEYRTEKGDLWFPPEQTLSQKWGDCDDWAIVEYFIIREIFMQLNVWPIMSHRLKCVAGNVNNYGLIPSVVGGHFYLLWLAEDCEWYTIESTYFRDRCLLNYLQQPHKFNPVYGVIWFTFNESYSWAQHSLTVTRANLVKSTKI